MFATFHRAASATHLLKFQPSLFKNNRMTSRYGVQKKLKGSLTQVFVRESLYWAELSLNGSGRKG